MGDQRHVLAASPPGKRPGIHSIGGWVGPRSGVDGCGKSRPHRDSISGPSGPQRVAIPTELSRTTQQKSRIYILIAGSGAPSSAVLLKFWVHTHTYSRRCEVFVALIINFAFFRYVKPCSLVYTSQGFAGTMLPSSERKTTETALLFRIVRVHCVASECVPVWPGKTSKKSPHLSLHNQSCRGNVAGPLCVIKLFALPAMCRTAVFHFIKCVGHSSGILRLRGAPVYCWEVISSFVSISILQNPVASLCTTRLNIPIS